MKIFITGGAGYKGTVLIPKLLAQGHTVFCYDTFWFGDYLDTHKNLIKIKGDIRQIRSFSFDKKIDVLIHLASIANDPCSDLDPLLTWEVSCQSTYELAEFCVKNGVPKVIYASSGSVYGVKEEDKVTEDLDLVPISPYNKTKICSEKILKAYAEKFSLTVIRPATVCGYSKRMRLDVAVNLLTMQALKNGKMTVLGGNQFRPNVHIQDVTDLYLFLIEKPELAGVYNCGFENMTIHNIAKVIQKYVRAEIIVKESNDPRSYRLDSTKLLSSGFVPKFTVEDAINEIVEKYNQKEFLDEEAFYNVNWMRRLMNEKIIF